MKLLIIFIAFVLSNFSFAAEAPSDYPIVKGIVRKIDVNSGRVSIKHDYIPNLDMPGMTMSFLAQDPTQLVGLAVGDKVIFAADDLDGELTILWIEKAPPPDVNTATILCTGIAPTIPKTKVEIEIKATRASTIRYEHIEGAYPGTSHVNSIGKLKIQKHGEVYFYRNGSGQLNTQLIFKKNGDDIVEACFSHHNAGMMRTPVHCVFH